MRSKEPKCHYQIYPFPIFDFRAVNTPHSHTFAELSLQAKAESDSRIVPLTLEYGQSSQSFPASFGNHLIVSSYHSTAYVVLAVVLSVVFSTTPGLGSAPRQPCDPVNISPPQAHSHPSEPIMIGSQEPAKICVSLGRLERFRGARLVCGQDLGTNSGWQRR
jgi:hypothetical protein